MLSSWSGGDDRQDVTVPHQRAVRLPSRVDHSFGCSIIPDLPLAHLLTILNLLAADLAAEDDGAGWPDPIVFGGEISGR